MKWSCCALLLHGDRRKAKVCFMFLGEDKEGAQPQNPDIKNHRAGWLLGLAMAFANSI